MGEGVYCGSKFYFPTTVNYKNYSHLFILLLLIIQILPYREGIFFCHWQLSVNDTQAYTVQLLKNHLTTYIPSLLSLINYIRVRGREKDM